MDLTEVLEDARDEGPSDEPGFALEGDRGHQLFGSVACLLEGETQGFSRVFVLHFFHRVRLGEYSAIFPGGAVGETMDSEPREGSVVSRHSLRPNMGGSVGEN